MSGQIDGLILPKNKSFLKQKFPKNNSSFGGDPGTAFKLMFGDIEEFFEIAENKVPRVEFGTSGSQTIRMYKGREWVQRFYNTLQDSAKGGLVDDVARKKKAKESEI
jgi:hypothetical protein